MSLYVMVFVAFYLASCNSSSAPTSAAKVDLSIYTTENVPGTSLKKISRTHSSGDIYEEGFVKDGVREGTWIVYYPNNGYIQTVSSYVNGVFTGPYIEFDERGRLLKQANYMNNELHGLYGEFKTGRPIKKIMYNNGAINGFVKEYNSRAELIKETIYKNNVLDGYMRHFNEDGKVVLEYIYKNGEKISGGIIE